MDIKKFISSETAFRLKRKIPHLTFVLFRTLFFIGMAYVVLYPVLIMVSRAFRSPDDMLNPQVVWLPQEFTLNNFKIVSEMSNFVETSLYSGRIAIICTILTMITCSMMGYALGRYNMKFRGLLMVLSILTIVVPIQTYLIPIYMQFRFFDFFGIGKIIGLFTGTDAIINLSGKEISMYILSVFGMGIRSGLFVLLFYQSFRSLPKELEDAARIDGCNEASVFLKVMLPNAGAPYLVTFILSIVWYWNDTVYGTILLKDFQPIAVVIGNIRHVVKTTFMGLQQYGIQPNGVSETVIYFAGALLFIIPPLVMYLIAQKFFIQSAERTGIVG